MRWLKWVGYGIGGLVLVILLGIGVVYAITSAHLAKKYEIPATPISVSSDSASLARGRHLATAIGKCVECHGENLAGRVLGDNAVFGRLVASNLTNGRGGALARYDDAAPAGSPSTRP
jgi:mono/diheme cytochrome c family protein